MIEANRDWVLLALIYPAMMLAEPLHIDGAISAELLHYANNDLQFLLTSHDPRLSRITVTASGFAPRPAASCGDRVFRRDRQPRHRGRIHRARLPVAADGFDRF
ncbi:hypothetical protein [Paracoccus sp. (in: a-proteobacteria)]|uniref:hypothetical protein n=1 Tax=Paracoccus sp. TaxID=267 RepID=UPI0026DED439|nr:hypothetical protein [Paracoccus sp. (in: a-proteobacteria)]MDO5647960.1 hypothetical protein [Paracoccus sp. (in: a-proteobacteria)]